MRYYPQLYRWPFVYLIAIAFGVTCVTLAVFAGSDPAVHVGYFVCAVFAFVAAWILWRSRKHYLDIDGEWVDHHGFKHWRVRELVRAMQSRSGGRGA